MLDGPTSIDTHDVLCYAANVAQLGYVLVAEEPEVSSAQVMADLPSAEEFLALNIYVPTGKGSHNELPHHANSCEWRQQATTPPTATRTAVAPAASLSTSPPPPPPSCLQLTTYMRVCVCESIVVCWTGQS